MRTYRSVNIEFTKTQNGKEKIVAEIPIRLVTMLSPSSIGFKQSCPDCQDHVGRKNWCPTCDKEIEYANIGKEFEGKQFTKEQLENLKTFDKVIKVKGIIDFADLDLRKVLGGYYLLPTQTKKGTSKSAKESKNTNDIATLVKGLEKTDKIFLVEFCVSSVQKLGIIINQDNELILKEYAYHENLKENDEALDYTPTELEIKGITGFIERQEPIKDITAIENEYRARVQDLVDGKIELKPLEVKTEKARFFE